VKPERLLTFLILKLLQSFWNPSIATVYFECFLLLLHTHYIFYNGSVVLVLVINCVCVYIYILVFCFGDFSADVGIYVVDMIQQLHGLSPRANYADRATAACRRSDCQLLRIEGATWLA
jgi:hypothetical protein